MMANEKNKEIKAHREGRTIRTGEGDEDTVYPWSKMQNKHNKGH